MLVAASRRLRLQSVVRVVRNMSAERLHPVEDALGGEGAAIESTMAVGERKITVSA